MLILTATNVSDLAPTSDYVWEVWVAGGLLGRKTLLAQGTVKGHKRADGWAQLVKAIAEAGEGQNAPAPRGKL